MTSYCVRCQSKTNDVNPHIVTVANGRTMKKSQCASCGGNKSEFTSESSIRNKRKKIGKA